MPRTRSASAHAKVIEAAASLFAERGIDGTSMDAIAEASGVSKATIYKHWADKEALLLEVMEHLAGIDQRPKFDSGDTRADLIAVLAYHPEKDARMRERVTPHFIAYAARNQAFGQLWRQRAMEPPRRDVRRLLEQGMAKGELAKIDLETAMPMLLGPLLYWHIFLRTAQPDPKPLSHALVDTLWRAYGTEVSRPAHRKANGLPRRQTRH